MRKPFLKRKNFLPSSLLSSVAAAQVNKKTAPVHRTRAVFVAAATDNSFFLFILLFFFYTGQKRGNYMKRSILVFFSILLGLSFFSCAHSATESSSIYKDSSSSLTSASSFALIPSEEGYIAGNGPGYRDGRSDGFDAGESAGSQNTSSPFDDEGSYEDGYASGYGQAYARYWLHGYINGYISQHPEIDEYDLMDAILYNFPDADISDLIDYLRSSQ